MEKRVFNNKNARVVVFCQAERSRSLDKATVKSIQYSTVK